MKINDNYCSIDETSCGKKEIHKFIKGYGYNYNSIAA